MHIISNIALISINETMIIQLCSFLVFMVVMNRIMFRPLQATMQERQTFITTLEQDISSANLAIEDIARRLKDEEAAMKMEAAKIGEALEAEGNARADELLRASRQEAAATRESMAAEVNGQITVVRQALALESEKLMSDIIEKIIGRRIAA